MYLFDIITLFLLEPIHYDGHKIQSFCLVFHKFNKKPLAQITKNLALPNIISPKKSIIQENQRSGGMDIHFQ